jgi:hypothetical protein
MTLYQTFNIPAQVGRWNKTFQITVIGDQLNKGFDNLEEGSSLELYMDSQITLIKFLPEE